MLGKIFLKIRIRKRICYQVINKTKNYKTNSHPIPSFSEIFKKQKKVDIVRDTPKHENNISAITSSEVVDNPTGNTSHTSQGLTNSQVDIGRNKLRAKKKKKNVVKAGVIDVNIEGPDINIPQTLENTLNNQLVGTRDKSMNKRKAIKGLRARTPAKIKKNNRGEKRLLPSDWYESERKKKKQYNIVRANTNYDMWRLCW